MGSRGRTMPEGGGKLVAARVLARQDRHDGHSNRGRTCWCGAGVVVVVHGGIHMLVVPYRAGARGEGLPHRKV